MHMEWDPSIDHSNRFDRAVRSALGSNYDERQRSLVKDCLVAYSPRLPREDRIPRFASMLGIPIFAATSMLDELDKIPVDYLAAPDSANVLSDRLIVHRDHWPDVPLVTQRKCCVACQNPLPAQATFPREWVRENRRKGMVRVAALDLKDKVVTAFSYPVICGRCHLAHHVDRAVRRGTSPLQQSADLGVTGVYVYEDFRSLAFFRGPGRDGMYYDREDLDLALRSIINMKGTFTGIEKTLEAARQRHLFGEVQRPTPSDTAAFERRKLTQAVQAYLVCVWYDDRRASAPSSVRAGKAPCSRSTFTRPTSASSRRCSDSANTSLERRNTRLARTRARCASSGCGTGAMTSSAAATNASGLTGRRTCLGRSVSTRNATRLQSRAHYTAPSTMLRSLRAKATLDARRSYGCGEFPIPFAPRFRRTTPREQTARPAGCCASMAANLPPTRSTP